MHNLPQALFLIMIEYVTSTFIAYLVSSLENKLKQ